MEINEPLPWFTPFRGPLLIIRCDKERKLGLALYSAPCSKWQRHGHGHVSYIAYRQG